MDTIVDVAKITELRATLKRFGLEKSEIRDVILELVVEGVDSLEALAAFPGINTLNLSPRLRSILKQIVPTVSSFNPEDVFYALDLFGSDPLAVSKVAKSLRYAKLDSWPALLEATEAELGDIGLDSSQHKTLLQLLAFSKSVEESTLTVEMAAINTQINNLQKRFSTIFETLSRAKKMGSAGFRFPWCSASELNRIEESYKLCSKNLQELAKAHAKVEFADMEKKIQRELIAYEDHLSPIVVNDTATSSIELGNSNTTFSQQLYSLSIENKELDRKPYTSFVKKDHAIFVGEDDVHGPLIVAVTSMNPKTNPNMSSLVLIRTRESDKIERCPPCDRTKEMLSAFKPHLPTPMQNMKLTRVRDPAFQQSMVMLEDQLVVKQYKFGILYVKQGQTKENDMYANSASPGGDYEEFLNFIGRKITLSSFPYFNGGLDVSGANRTGEYSVYEKLDNLEVMFHVSTLLPDHEGDEQKLERKRHLGNDIVVIVFLESDEDTFNPSCLATQFTYIFIVITADHRLKHRTGQTYYRVNVLSKVGVRSFGPAIPKPAIFRKSPEFKRFLLTKLVNGERAAMTAETFAKKSVDTREKLFSYYIGQIKE
eukprot:TRINITY_DN748_c0_g1_i1.p1 TRINITY_DN748_c0_g1~~TRINITY_DN748_c0_g1_i1.p1  ORF type:complete len:609 (+),score=159.41 TRINITY_DN748_c0_g1_i1:34-1827(+)